MGWWVMCIQHGEVLLELMVVAECCLPGQAAPVHELTRCGGGSSLAAQQMYCYEQPWMA